jgi:hypothetical protein
MSSVEPCLSTSHFLAYIPSSMSPTKFVVVALLSVLAWTSASPVLEERDELDVWTPHILSPTADTVWRVTQVQTVTW